MEKELEIKCPHCEDLNYIEVDSWYCASANEAVCTQCGETFFFTCKAEISLDKIGKTEEDTEE